MRGSYVSHGPLRPLKWYKQLTSPKGRLQAGAFLVEGARHVSQVIAAAPQAVLEVIASGETRLPVGSFPRRRVSDLQMRAIANSSTPQGLVAVVRLPEDASAPKLPPEAGGRVLLLEDVQDPGNVGALIRTAAAFEFQGVILSHKCADPYGPKCVQASAGSLLSLWLRRTAAYAKLAKDLQERGYTLAAATLVAGDDLAVLEREKLVLALGNEAGGLSPAITGAADRCVSIPMARSRVESLNVAASGAILMYLARP